MIKIIKEGKKSFVETCPKCGCEFEYELEDVDASGAVRCPYCEERIIHKSQAGGKRDDASVLGAEIPFPYPVYPNLTKTVTVSATNTSEK